jgi:hypothetical protein
MKKFLFISNSFGVDSTRYLYGISRAAKRDIKVATLYIGGCSLYRHYRNMLSEDRVYDYYLNGVNSGLKVSLKETLLSDEWDVVATQQASPQSGDSKTYFPYIKDLAAYIRKLAPAAELWLQMTWSFEEGHKRFGLTSFETRAQMIPAIRAAYTAAAKEIQADLVVPALDAMNKLYDAIGERTYRDGFHCSKGVARYMLGCLWFLLLFQIDVQGNTFADFDVEVSEEEIALAQRFAKEAALENQLFS